MAFTRPPVTPANSAFGPLGAAAWAAGFGVSGANVGGVLFCPTATSETTDTGLTVAGTGATLYLSAGGGFTGSAGTKTACGFNFASDAGTGFYERTTSRITVSLGGTPEYEFQSTGFATNADNVGVGWCVGGVDAAGVSLAISYVAAGIMGVGTGATGSFAARIKLTSTITAAVAVGSLNASPTIGEVQTVNDALTVTVKGATVSAGGSAVCQVMWNGSNWVGI